MRTPIVVLLGAGVLAGVVLATRARHASPGAVHAVTDAELLAADSSGGWLLHGRTYDNRRFAPFTEIDRRNVARLAPVWHYEPQRLLTSRDRNESTPLVVDGMLIYTEPGKISPGNHVIAVDPRTGREIWSWGRRPGPAALCCGVVNRGVALLGDKVYVATLDAHLVALDRRTGTVVWDQQVAEPSQGYSFTMAPLATAGRIVVGVSGGEFAIRGFVDAYDPASGARVWRFWTVPSPEEGGWWGRLATTTPEGDRLPRDTAQERRDSARYADAWRRGGGPVWSTPAYDAAQRLVIFGTGNPSAVAGRAPPGDNLYTTSLVAVDVATGKLRWHYQMVPHNIWDYDAASPPVLLDIRQGDSVVPAVAHAGKTGWVYILDRRTGTLLRRSEPFVPLENIFPAPTLRGIRTSPGTRGGSNWPPTAYSPATGTLYVLGSYIPMTFAIDSAAAARSGAEAATGGKPHESATGAVFHKIENDGRFGTFSAIDVATGKVRWQRKVPKHLMYGGALATAGGLVFFGQTDGLLLALDAETGARLWQYRLGDRAIGPPISFMEGGRQRIAVTSGRGVTVFGLPAR